MRRTFPAIAALILTLATASRVDAQLATDQAGDALGSKLFLGSTGRSLKQGEAYFAVDTIFLQTMQVGVTDHFSIGVVAPFLGAGGAGLTPKFQIYRDDRTAVAAGMIHVRIRDTGTADVTYVSMTRGSESNALTLGVGRISRGILSNDGAVMVLVGTEHRTSRRTKMMTEHYISRGGVISLLGVRRIGRRVSQETGLLVMLTSAGPLPPAVFFNFAFHTAPR